MRPQRTTPAHVTDNLAELVCSNSLGSLIPHKAPGLLKAEMRGLGSLILRCASESAVPAGSSLAVDRDRFAALVAEAITTHSHIELVREEVTHIPDDACIVATGPLTSDALATEIAQLSGRKYLYFYDALSPIVNADSIDMSIAFRQSRHDDGELEALRTVRRAYHTLKGSGRMVGAELIGEYCWSIEHLLNRIIDGAVLNSQPLSAFMQRANIAVAELLEQLEVGTEPASDIAALMAEAEALGRPVAAPEPEQPADSSDATEVLPVPSIDAALGRQKTPVPVEEPELGPVDATMVATHISMSPPGMDPVLLDILSREVAAHLSVLREFVAAGSESLRQPLPEDVFRACHTLHGNLTMAGVTAAVNEYQPRSWSPRSIS